MGTKKLIKKMDRQNARDMKMTKRGAKFFQQVMSRLALMGTCHCGGSLFSFYGDDEHPFNAYCFECGSITDVRTPKIGDTYKTEEKAPTPAAMIQYIYNNNTDFKITDEMVKTLPIDPEANSL